MSESKVFQGTKKQEDALCRAIEAHRSKRGGLISVLHEAQEIYGYIPLEVQKIISEGLDIPLAEVYGVVTFYTQFTLNPKGKHNIGVCMGTACYVKGSGAILDKIKEKLGLEVGGCTPDGRFSLDATRCIGACGLAPVITVGDDVYGRLKLEDIEDIIKKYQND